LPGLLIQPQTNFLYVSNSNPIYLNSELYSVADGKIIKTEAEPTKKPTNIPIQINRITIGDVQKIGLRLY